MTDRRRQIVDRVFGVLVRTASLMVLIAVAGVLIQMVMVARPLFVAGDLTARNSPEEARWAMPPSLPPWAPQDLGVIATAERGGERLWVAIDKSGALVGARGTNQTIALPDTDDWRYQPLQFPPDAAGSDPRWLVIAPGWRHVGVVSGNAMMRIIPIGDQDLSIRAVSLLAAAEPLERQQGQPQALKLRVLAGEQSFITWHSDVLLQWHWVAPYAGAPRAPTLLRQHRASDSIDRLAVAPAGQRIAYVTGGRRINVWHTTSNRLIAQHVMQDTATSIAWADATRLNVTTASGSKRLYLRDSAGAVTLSTLFQPVHYEGYAEPTRRWLPGDAGASEPKLSVLPLVFGTIKAAVIALIIAVPIGIGAATFVGFFLSPRSRDRLKPVLELLSAFPSVVLGALTALLIAPYFLDWLPGLLGATVVTPIGVLVGALVWRGAGAIGRGRTGVGWLPFILLPLVSLTAFVGFVVGQAVSDLLPFGSLINYLEQGQGIAVVHRNALLVGTAMGVAVIPTVFSIAEDAIHAVPARFAAGSLALGATHWQSYRDVVFPVALPGVIAAAMIGFGRAVGETRIVLLVASHTPIFELNIMEGFRSVAATLALELPEAPFESVHYRVLFASGLALFALTFALNSLAEFLRVRSQRLWADQT